MTPTSLFRFVAAKPHLGAWLLSALLWAWASPVQAQSYQAVMKRAIKHYDNLQFPKALAILQRLAKRRGLSKQKRAVVYLYQGFCMFYIRSPRLARFKFTIALKLDPKLRTPKQTPPPLRRLVALERSRLGIKPPPPPLPTLRFRLNIQAPKQAGGPITFRGTCTQRPFGARLFVLIRKATERRYKTHRLQWQGTQCYGQIPNPYPPGFRGKSDVFYVFQAKRGLQLLATSPPLAKPKRFMWTFIPPTAPTPDPKKPKSNAGLAVGLTLGLLAVVGGGVALAVYLIDQPSGPSVKVRINITPVPGD